MNYGTRRTSSINRSKSCLFNINTHRQIRRRPHRQRNTQSKDNATCARNQLSLSINAITRQKYTDWLPHCSFRGQFRHVPFLSVFLCFHQGWLITPDGRAAICAFSDWIDNVSFEQFSKSFDRMFQFYSILAVNNIIPSTSVDTPDDHHYSANETSKQDSSLDRNWDTCLLSNMKRYEDESSEHTSSRRSTSINIDETLSPRYVHTSIRSIPFLSRYWTLSQHRSEWSIIDRKRNH
jgi:hypothetical protein